MNKKSTFPKRFFFVKDKSFLAALFLILSIFILNIEKSFAIEVDSYWGGHMKMHLTGFNPQSEGEENGYDFSTDFRVINQLSIGAHINTDFHVTRTSDNGDSRRRGDSHPPSDSTSFFNLTSTTRETDDSYVAYRVDRMMVSYSYDSYEVRAGRQAVSWGNGFTFNPMDIFNPFSPTAVDKDYKTGNDLILARGIIGSMDTEVMYIPRRDELTGEVMLEESSFAGRTSFAMGNTGFDIVAANHYEDYILGLGVAGYLGAAAWRTDVTYTFLDENSSSRDLDGYFSAVANVDYSWIWGNYNFYGFVELYYNGLSNNDYNQMLNDQAVIDRIERGELYALGNLYSSAGMIWEIHPLFLLHLTTIVNMHDGSGLIQPRTEWSIAEDVVIHFIAQCHWGSEGTEYGGFYHENEYIAPSNSISAWISWYF